MSSSQNGSPLKDTQPAREIEAAGAGDESTQAPFRSGSDWIAEVSHELRLPIANIKLLVETILEGAIDDRDAALRMLARTKQEVQRLEALVSDLMSMEEVTHNRDEMKRRAVLLADAARYAQDSVAKLAFEKEIRVQTEIEPGFTINANPDQLNQVLLNLVENAVKYTPTGGEVVIKSGARPGSFSVSDNGIGIPAQEIPKIFKRFYRVNRTRAPGSTGLGLSIVKHIVELHGGKISVQSQELGGSTFFLDFPEGAS